MRLSGARVAVGIGAVILGCGGDDGGTTAAQPTTVTATMTGDPTSSTSNVSQTDADPGKLDVAMGGDGPTNGMADDGANQGGCEKVDVVFAVDNSSSMQEEIAALRGPVFDAFPQALLAVGNGLSDFQLAVIDGCNNPAAFHDQGASGPCNFSTQTNWMVSDSPDLATEFACVTELTAEGWSGMTDACSGDNDDEQPTNAAADAVTADALNAGFVREDAVLVVVAITDEDESPLPERTADQIADQIIAAKGSISDVVFLGIGGSRLCDGEYGTALPANTLQAVAQRFEVASRGVFWDLCDGDLETAFANLIDVVDSACLEFDVEE